MVEEVKTTLKEIKESFMEEMQNRGDIMVFLIAALATLILWPLGVLYLLLIKPIYKSIRIRWLLLDIDFQIMVFLQIMVLIIIQ